MAEFRASAPNEQTIEPKHVQVLRGSNPADHVGDASLLDIVLDGQFKVEKLLRHDNHAVVYSATSFASPTISFEARAYVLEGIPQKLRQYRLRNMKRLSSRVVLETRWQGMAVIMYRTNAEGGEDPGDNNLTESLPLRGQPDLVIGGTKAQQKTDTRHRQLERRRSGRRKHRYLKAAETTSTTSDTEVEGDEEEFFNDLSSWAYTNWLDLRWQRPLTSRTIVETCLEKQDKFEGVDQLEAFMDTKHSELIYLCRQQEKLLAIVREWHDESLKVDKEQSRLPRALIEWQDMQLGRMVRARVRMRLIMGLHEILARAVVDYKITR
ncbi:uncharacterized protein BP5553_06818 [Venustampulla echinocandica]|uniref:Uncharacterized protein n=1 Tax=Venustampulla echinocandica TaxID=2656787 RepID=A0A370TL01_9HELO|nr:uncharacterized protein BP5553_06818 [Venustampulla echinocandica]RDL36206.1 hypothetical protein BP5553_06818 [Venustampulla echinocandica]